MLPYRIPTFDESTPIFEATDRHNVPVSLRWTENIAIPNRGWVVHEMSAWRFGERVGFLRLSYVPKTHIAVFQPTVLHHLGAVGGWGLPALFQGPYGPARDLDSLTDAEVAEVCACVCAHLETKNKGWTSISTMMKDLRSPLHHRGQASYERFQADHVDQPVVDYVRTDLSPLNGVFRRNKRQGLGLLLYGATAHHLATMGMLLHASSLQSPDDQRMWAFFQHKGWTAQKGARTVLQPHIHNHPHHILAHCPSTSHMAT
jgi:hypothetical protein